LLLLLGRVLALGFERPVFKALARDRDSVIATSLAYTLALGVLTPLVLLGVIGHEPFANLHAWLHLALISGTIAALGYNLYMYALSRGDVSVLAPVYATGLLFLYLIELTYGTAHFSWLALLGILCVTAGISLLSTEGEGWRRLLNPHLVLREPGVMPMLAAALLLAVVRVIDKSANGIAPEGGYAVLATVPTVAISAAILFFTGRLRMLATLFRERPAAAVGSAAAHISGYLLLLGAYRYFNASLVEPVGQLALFVNLALGWLWFREPVGARWLPAALVAAGAVLVLISR